MRARIEIGCRNPKLILDSLKPDMEDIGKFRAELKAEDSRILLSVESDDISGLMAGINSYLKLIRLSEEVQKNE